MRKILLVFDGQHFSNGAFEFARRLNETQPILLTGLFLPSIDYTNTMTYYLGMAAPYYTPLLDSEAEIINENIEKFKSLCEKQNIEYRVHDQIDDSILAGIRKETRYSDMLILSSDLFYNNLGAPGQKEYLHQTEHNAECPIVLIPEEFRYPERVILAYDGSASSVFAIKQFAYLFPELTSKETILIYASETDRELPDFDYIKELAARHYSSLDFLKLEIDPKHYFSTWVQEAGPVMLVAGAYDRSLISEVFKRSFISEVVKEHQIPVFVAHQ